MTVYLSDSLERRQDQPVCSAKRYVGAGVAHMICPAWSDQCCSTQTRDQLLLCENKSKGLLRTTLKFVCSSSVTPQLISVSPVSTLW